MTKIDAHGEDDFLGPCGLGVSLYGTIVRVLS
jgi:hypothetical protein